MKPIFPERRLLATLLVFVAAAYALGSTQTWSGGGTNSNWTTPANWTGGVAPVTNDSLVFAGSSVTNINDFSAGTVFGSLAFSAGSGAFTLGGNSVVLGGNVTDSATVAQKVNLTLDLGSASRVFTVVTNGQLIVSQPISGAPGVVKDGPGTLTVSATNAYTGATIVSNGTMRLDQSGAGSPVSGMLYWLDASDGATLTVNASNRVSQWSDKSGNSQHFTQAAAARQPLLVANALSGKPVLRFDGVTNRLVLGSSTSPQTVFIVNKVTTGSSLRGIWGLNQADTGIRMTSATAWQQPGNANDFGNPAGSAMYINGIETSTFTASAAHLLEVARSSSTTYAATGLGDYFSSGSVPPRPFCGDIAEVLVYGRALSVTERQQVESYLALKWLGGPGPCNDLLPAATAVNLTADGATLDLNGTSQGVASLAGVAGSRVLLGAATLTVGGGNASSKFSGILSGTGALTKSGSGTLTVAAENTYSGATTISNGTVRFEPCGYGAPVSGMLYWLDAADRSTLTVDGANRVSQWSDKSGNSQHFTQSTAARQPLLVASALGGRSALRFDGVTNRLVLGSSTSPQTVFIVTKVTLVAGNAGIWGVNQADTGIRLASATSWYQPGNANDFGNPAGSDMLINGVVTNVFTAGVPHLLEVVRSSSTTFAATGLGDYFSVGSNPPRPFGGDIAEVLVYGSVLTTAQRQQVETYLAAKWLGGPGTGSDLLPTATALNLTTNSATLDLNGTSQTIASLAGVAGSRVLMSNATLTVSGSASCTFSGVLSGAGALTKSGSGTLSLGGTNTFTGKTLLNTGTIKLISGGALAGSTNVTLASGTLFDVSAAAPFALSSGRRLSGAGSVTGLVTVASGSTVAPGNTRGTLTFQGGLTLQSNSAVEVEVDSSADLVRISGGTFTCPSSGATRIDVLAGGGLGTFTLIDWAGATPSGVSTNAFTLGTVPSGFIGSLQIVGTALQLSLVPGGPQTVATNTLASLRLAINDLALRYPADYGPKAVGYLARLTAIEADYLGGSLTADSAYQFLKRDALVLNNPALSFNRLMFVRRSGGTGLPSNWQNVSSVGQTSCNDTFAVLDITNNAVSTLYTPSMSQFLGYPNLHWNGDRILFTGQMSTNGSRPYTVFEMKTDGTGLKQVSPAAGSDIDWFDACYLPCGDLLMASTATFAGVPCVTGADYVGNLYRVATNGTVRQLTFDQDQNWGPTVLPDGRVMFTRWEYSDVPHYFSRILFTMMPDGLEQFARYGSGSFFPNTIFDAKPVPGKPSQFVAVISGHHGVAREGELLLFDEAVGTFEADGVLHRFCGPNPVVPEVHDTYIDDRDPWPRFVQPCPLDEKQLVVSARISTSGKICLYLVDQFDNITTLYADSGSALMHATPLKAVTAPPMIPDRVKIGTTNGIVNVSDLYFGPGLKDVPRGKIKSLRVYSVHYGYRNQGGHVNIGVDGPWDVHRILGTVPVYADGSASFNAPANTPISVQPLDEEGKALQLFRSWYTVMPGESVSCAGCHEKRNVGMVNQATIASRKAPDDITPWFGPERGFSFLREVQPVLDQYCVGCHGGGGGTTNVAPNLYTTDRVVPPNTANSFPQSYTNLHRYVRRTGNEGYFRMNNAGEWHADTSELVQILKKGHYGVTLDTNAWSRLVTWIDLNVPAWGLWGEHSSAGSYTNAHARRLQTLQDYANVTTDPELYPTPDPARGTFVAPVAPPAITPVTPPADSLFDAAGAKARRNAATNSATPAELTYTLGNGVNLVLDLIPAGRVLMGSASGYRDEAPQTIVTNSRPFYMAKFEIMNKQYALFDPAHSSGFMPVIGKDHNSEGWSCTGTNQPVIRVSWSEAIKYCEWLTKKTGRKFSLPTEAQWEYACRAGTATDMWYGPASFAWTNRTQLIAGDSFYVSGMLDNLAGLERQDNPTPNQTFSGSTPPWHMVNPRIRDSWVATADATSFASNPFGLCGMHGNAAEWTRSTYAPYPYTESDGRNRAVYTADEWLNLRKVVRGGSCEDRERRATASFRTAMYAWQRGYNVGFRVMADVSAALSGLPTASVTATPTNGTAALTVSFDGSSSRDDDGTLFSYAWDFGDGTSASGTNAVTHLYSVPGNYVATLTVTDDDGFTATVSNRVSVLARTNNALAPVAQFTSTPSAGAAPCRVTFDGTASSAPGGTLAAWYWDFGDGLIGSGATAAHTYRQAGRYLTSLTVIDGFGLRDTRTGTVTVTGTGGNQAPRVEAGLAAVAASGVAAPLAGFASDDALPQAPGTLTVTWSKVKGPGTVAFGNASVTNTTVTFSTNGVYVLQLSASDGELTGSDTVSYTVSDQGVYHSPQEVAWSPDGSLLAVADVTAHALSLISPVSSQVLRTIALAGEPRDLLWNGTNRLWVSEYDAGSVAEINPLTGAILRRLTAGPKPSGLALVPGKNMLLVTDRGLNRVALLDLASGETRAHVSVIRDPVFITVTPDQQFALVANHLPLGDGRDPLLGAELSLINLNDPSEVSQIQLPAGASSVQRPVCSPDGRWAYVPHLQGRSHLPTTQLSRGWVSTSALSVIDLQNKQVYATALFDQSVDGAANPWGITLSADGGTLWASLSGVRELARLNLRGLQAMLTIDPSLLANLGYDLSTLYRSNLVQRISLAAEGPRGIALSPDQTQVAVATYFAGQVLLIGTNGATASTITLGAQPAEDTLRRGERLFHDANGSYQRWVSCVTCHPGARADGMNWDMMNDGFGNPKNTKSLLYATHTEPAMWTGIRANAMVGVQAGFKFIEFQAHPQQDYDDIYNFLAALEPEPSPYWVNGKLTPDAVQGKAIFESSEARCLHCHRPDYYYAHTNKYDVATRHEYDWSQNDITGYVPPPLYELWRTAPYLHDGSAQTIRDVLTTFNADDKHGKTSHLSPNQIDQLAAYLLQIGGDLPAVGTNACRLNVFNGDGGGTYLPGSTVTIAAMEDPPGLAFARWIGQPVLQTNAPATVLLMPDTDTSATALFQDIPGLPDSNGDGIPDSWTWLHFGHATGLSSDLSRAQDDADGDGRSNAEEYISGTNPQDPNDFFFISIFGAAQGPVVGFDTLPAAGYGYSGLARYYELDNTTNLSSSSWSAVPGFSSTLGAGQFVSVTNTLPAPQQFFRGRVWLQPIGQ